MCYILYMVNLAENIYLWRIFRGLSQEQLAKRSGVPRPNLSSLESGKREPSLPTLRLLAAGLGVTAGGLVNGVPPINLKPASLSRDVLENIVKASLGKENVRLTAQQKHISVMLSGVIKNRVNASGKIYKNTLRGSQACAADWLLLKAGLGQYILGNLLLRLDKHLGLNRGQEAD